MPKLKMYYDKACLRPVERLTIDAGEWDIAIGAKFEIYAKNESQGLKAKFLTMTHTDPRTKIDYPEEILAGEVKKISVDIKPVDLDSVDNEMELFKDVFDEIVGKIKWQIQ